MRKTAAQRGYDAAWRKLRAEHLRREPWCRMCSAQGLKVRAVHVDHIKAHRGDRRLLTDTNNLQALCVPCHNREKQGQEVRGYSSRVGADGLPVDQNHPFFR